MRDTNERESDLKVGPTGPAGPVFSVRTVPVPTRALLLSIRTQTSVRLAHLWAG